MKTYLLLVLLLVLVAAPVRAQDEEYPPNQASLTLAVEKNGGAKASLQLPAAVSDQELLKRTFVELFSFPVHVTDTREFDAEVEDSDEISTVKTSDRPWTMVFGESARALSHNGMRSTCRINPEPLIRLLQSHNVPNLRIRVFFENAPDEMIVEGLQKLTAVKFARLTIYETLIDVRAPSHQIINFSAGYSTSDILKRSIPLIAVLFLPVLWTTRSTRKFADRPEELWGRHWRTITRLLNVIWIVWLPVYSLSGVDRIIAFMLGPDRQDMAHLVNLTFYFVPPIFALLLCHFASRKVYELVPAIEFSPSDVVRHAITMTAFSLAPLFLIFLGINTFRTNPRQAALYAVIGYVGWLLLTHTLRKALEPNSAELTEGDLRDRVFDLARKAGVLLQQVYVVPENRAQLANAFARSDDCVGVTNSVLKHLSRREVDAVMAHEIGHLQARHPHMRRTIQLVIIISANVVGSLIAWIIDLQQSAAVVFSGALALSTLAVFFISRRNERQADAIGVGLTGDPEAFISGLSKLSRLSLAPMQSGLWAESLDTHPGTQRRFQRIAELHGISTERLQQLVADSNSSPDDTYSAIDTGDDTQWVFSPYFKKKYSMRNALMLLGIMLLPPVPFAILFTANSGFVLVPISIAAVACCFALVQLVKSRIRFSGQASHARKLRIQLEKRGLADVARSGTIVGLAPAAESRTYEGFPFWDVGALWLTNDKLYYVGELTGFAIERERVHNVYTEDANPEWLPEKNLFLVWQKDDQTDKETLHFVAIGERSVWRARRAMDLLQERLERWRNQSEDLASVAGLESLVGPSFPETTGVPTLTSFHPRVVFAVGFQFACYAALVGFAVRLSVLGMFFVAVILFVGTVLDELPKSFRKRVSIDQSFDPATYERGSWADSNAAKS